MPTATEDAADGPPLGDVDLDAGPILLFDGVCNLCSGLVQFMLPRDSAGVFRYASLQSEVGTALLRRHDLPPDALDTVVLLDGDRAYTKSAAAIRVGELLGFPYSLAAAFRVVPRRLRDAVYDYVAVHRYRWFGEKDECMRPPDGHEPRFLD